MITSLRILYNEFLLYPSLPQFSQICTPVLVPFLLPWQNTITKTKTYKRKHLLWGTHGSRRLEFMIIRTGNIVTGRWAQYWSGAGELTSNPQTGSSES